MPTYKLTDPQTGVSVKLIGDSPPSEAELNQIFSKSAQTFITSRSSKDRLAAQGIDMSNPQESVDKIAGMSKVERDNPVLAGSVGALKETAASLGTAAYNTPGDLYETGAGLVKGIYAGDKYLAGQVMDKGGVGAAQAIASDLWKVLRSGAIPEGIKNYALTNYGSVEGFRKHFEQHPIGVAMDLAAVLSGGGAVLKGGGMLAKAGGAARVGEALAGAGETATQAGARVAAAPVNAVGVVAEKAIGKMPERLYQSALGATGKRTPEEVGALVKTGLEEKIPVSAAGYEKAGNIIETINDDIGKALEAGSQSGGKIKTSDVIKRLEDRRDNFYAKTALPESNVSAINNAIEEFSKHGEYIPLNEAQKIKVNTYKVLKDTAYGELKGVNIEAQKTIARGVKEEIVKQAPELAALNERDSRMIALEKAIGRRVNVEMRKNLVSADSAWAATAAEAITGSPGAAITAGTLKHFFNGAGRSHVAIALNKARKVAQKAKTLGAGGIVSTDGNTPPPAAETPAGAFGPTYKQFQGKPQEAVSHLLEVRDGEAVGALSHPEIGPIDLVWGKVGDPKKDYAGGYGLAKIEAKHPEVIDKLGEIIQGANILRREGQTVTLSNDAYRAGVRLDWDGHEKRWLVTAFEVGARKARLDAGRISDISNATRGEMSIPPSPQGEPKVNIPLSRSFVNSLPAKKLKLFLAEERQILDLKGISQSAKDKFLTALYRKYQ